MFEKCYSKENQKRQALLQQLTHGNFRYNIKDKKLQKFFVNLVNDGYVESKDYSTKSGMDVRYKLSASGFIYLDSEEWRRTWKKIIKEKFLPDYLKEWFYNNFKDIFIVVAAIISLIIYLINSCKQ